MPPIPTVVGGHTIRDPPQLDAGASVNMFPERSQRETEYQNRRSRFQLSTHGYESFNHDATQPGVTAMSGSRERTERLAVANGRTIRLFRDPGSNLLTELTVSGQPNVDGSLYRQPSPRLIPTLGCAHIGDATDPWYWVRQDGTVWWNSTNPADRPPATNGEYDGAPIETDDGLGGITPLGMAALAGSSPPDAARLWLTCYEDRRIRCWRKVTVDADGNPLPAGRRRFERDLNHELDLAEETAANSPESLWFQGGRLLILDAVTGRVLEYEFNEGSTPPWPLDTPRGESNPISMQRLNGDRNTLEPLVYGGIHATAGTIRVVNREANKYTVSNRRTALRTSAGTATENLPDVRETPGTGGNVFIGGAVSGQTRRAWFVSGTQYSDDLCRVYQLTSTPLTYERLTNLPRMPDALPKTPRPTQIVPLGDRGRYLGWVLDRRLHLIDLEKDRVIQNVEGQIDRLDVTRDQFIAADASIGEVKASPLFQVAGQLGATDAYGQRVEAASLRVTGVGTDDDGNPQLEDPEEIVDAYVGVREVLTVTKDGKLWYYKRRHLEPNPDEEARSFRPTWLNAPANQADPLPDARKVHGVCVAGTKMAIFLGSGVNLEMRVYDLPPKTRGEFDSTTNYNSTAFTLPADGIPGVRSYAASSTRLFILQNRDVVGLRIGVYDRPTRRLIQRLDLGADNAKRAELFGHLNLEIFGNAIHAITFVTDYDPRSTESAEGFLLVSARGPEETTAVALEVHGESGSEEWFPARARDLPSALTRENTILTHDAQFVYDSSAQYAPITNPDGVPTRIVTLTALRHALVAALNQYSWPQETRNLSGASAIAAIRRWMYTWSPTGMEIRDQGDRTVGFPYRLAETRTIGVTSPRSIAVVADRLYWLGTTEGGGLRVWVLGRKGDTVPEPVYGKAIEEMLDRIAEERPGALERAVAWADDTGGHPTYVLHIREAGISLAYDADADRWHVRSSRRKTPVSDDANLWAAWLPNTEGVQRVTHSTAWRGRLICGGYDRDGGSVLAFYSQNDWRDIDGGEVLRRRQFAAGEMERERVYFNKLRVDTTYRAGTKPPSGAGARTILRALNAEFEVSYSNNGGVSFDVELEPRRVAADPPEPYFRIGYSRQRVYRVDRRAAIPFALMGAYQEAAP